MAEPEAPEEERGPPLKAICRNPHCPSKRIIEGMGPAFLVEAELVLASPDKRGLYRCGWCDKVAEPVETPEEAQA